MLIAVFCLLCWVSWGINLEGCYKKTFKVSAYYSPLPWQRFYYKWNYRAEIRLNWRWIKWASWKYVFNGMIAAPKNYKFWTKIYFPGLWVWEVADRWQAIVSKWQRWEKFDRIDIWVGKWEKWLMRALSFWKKIMVWYVCPSWKKIKVWFDFNKFPILPNFFEKTLWWVGLYVWRKDKWVLLLQNYLKKLWYFNHEPTGYFWPITKKAVAQFQKDYWITTRFLWYFWPKTRATLKKVLKEKWILKVSSNFKETKVSIDKNSSVSKKKILLEKELSILQRWLWKGYHTYEVKIVQKYLKKLWYYNWPINWYYDEKTVEAVSKFQIDNWIITSSNYYAAGWFWPKTRQVFKEIVIKKFLNS